MKEYMSEIVIEEIIDFFSTVHGERNFEGLADQFRDFVSVTKFILHKYSNCAEVRDLSDRIIDIYPQTKTRLSTTSEVAPSDDFKVGIIKLQEKSFSQLSEEEKSRNRRGAKEKETINCKVSDRSETSAKCILKRHRTEILLALK